MGGREEGVGGVGGGGRNPTFSLLFNRSQLRRTKRVKTLILGKGGGENSQEGTLGEKMKKVQMIFGRSGFR